MSAWEGRYGGASPSCRAEDGAVHEPVRSPRYDVEILTGDRALAAYFEETVKLFPEAKTVSNWIMSELSGS